MSDCCVDRRDYVIELLRGNKTESLDFDLPYPCDCPLFELVSGYGPLQGSSRADVNSVRSERRVGTEGLACRVNDS